MTKYILNLLALIIGAIISLSLPSEAVVTKPTSAAGGGIYTLQFHMGASSPADATTYYLGGLFSQSAAASATNTRILFPAAGTITKIQLRTEIIGVAGSAETSTIVLRLNNTSDVTISATLNTSISNAITTTVSQAVAANDYFNIKWVSPTWATNPTNIVIYGTVYIEL